MTLNLFHALRIRGLGKPDHTSQTDRTKTITSGDSPERRAFDFKRIPDVDDKTVEAFFAATHEGARRMPLLIAQYVYAQLEDELTSPGRMSEMRLAEIRGGMAALRRFGIAYESGIAEWQGGKRRRGEDA